MTFNIRDYGAQESDFVVTKAIQAAIDDCHNNGGGEVVIPEGIYRTGSVWLRSGVTLHLMSGAYLEGSDDCDDYAYVPEDLCGIPTAYAAGKICPSTDPYSRWSRAIIKAVGCENIAIIGEKFSYIDGVNCYDSVGEEGYRGPHPINIHSCKNVTLKGYTVRNGANWAHAIFASENVLINNVRVLGGHDGIDVFICKNVEISDCVLHTGDDCIAGYGSVNVTVKNCDFSTACSVFRFGGTNVRVSSCKQHGPSPFCHRYGLTDSQREHRVISSSTCRRNTLTAFLYYCDNRFLPLETPGNIIIEDSEFEAVDAMFHINFGNHVWCSGTSLESISFKNCRFGELCEPTYIYTDKELPFTLTLENVTMSAADGSSQQAIIDGALFDEIILKNVHFSGFDEPTVTVSCGGKITKENTDDFAVTEKEYTVNHGSK